MYRWPSPSRTPSDSSRFSWAGRRAPGRRSSNTWSTRRYRLPYFLHSCGNLDSLIDDLIDDVRIDGKHSFEDAILPAEDFQARHGGRIVVLGGLDVNILSAGSEDDVRRRTRALMDICGERGLYAVGSGNSIPSYVPVCNYLAMVDEALG